MVYIFTEDNTSGLDFITEIVNIVCPNLEYKIDSAFGCGNLLSLLSKYDDIIKVNDIVILYFDSSTFNLKIFDSWFKTKVGITVYLQNFYCFESAFFSYTRFVTGQLKFGTITNQNMFFDFRNTLLNSNNSQLLAQFKQKYNFTSTETLEQYADRVFNTLTFKTMPCLNVTKHNYKTLLECKNMDTHYKFFYNNLCNTYTQRDINKGKKGILSYCEQHRQKRNQDGFVDCQYMSTLYSCNLEDFYYNSVLSNPFKQYISITKIINTEVCLHTLK